VQVVEREMDERMKRLFTASWADLSREEQNEVYLWMEENLPHKDEIYCVEDMETGEELAGL
jgi:hypothetical protein